MTAATEVRGVSHSQLHARLAGPAKARWRRCRKEGDAIVAPRIVAPDKARPTYDYRPIKVLLNRQFRAEGARP